MFLPSIESLIPKDTNDPSFAKTPKNYLEEYQTLIWCRPSEIFPDSDFKVFLGNTKPTDISQGSLGNCYLLVALMGLAKHPERIYRLLITQVPNSAGAYTVRLLLQGQIKFITIDDFFPCKPNKKLAFSITRDKELWLSIVEKAWTKANDCCYMKTWLGIPSEALGALCEAPTIYENHKKYLKHDRLYEIWEKVLLGFKKKWVICANTEEVKNTEKMGLVENHAYGVIGAWECDIDYVNNSETFVESFSKKYPHFTGEKLRLVKIRNPWGCKEWKGDFSNSSSLWTDKLKRQAKFDQDRLEGVFYMTFEDFADFFPWSFFCKIEDNYYYNYGKAMQSREFKKIKFIESKKGEKQANNDESVILEAERETIVYPFCRFFLEVKTRTHCYICLHQPQKRFLNNYLKRNKSIKTIPGFKTPLAQIILVQYEPELNYHRYIKGDFINWEKLYLEAKLDPGEYHIYCRVHWKYVDVDCKLVVSTYSDYPLEIYELKNQGEKSIFYDMYKDVEKISNFTTGSKLWIYQVLKQIALRSRKKDYFSEREPQSYFSYDIFDNSVGFGVFYYENNSSEGTINSMIQFENVSGVRVLTAKPDQEGIYNFQVGPKTDLVLVFEILDVPWESTISWSHVKWFEYSKAYMIEHFLDEEEMCQKEEIEKGDIIFSQISHDTGYVIHIQNKSRTDYRMNLNFMELVNLTVIEEDFKDNALKMTLPKRTFFSFEIKKVKKNLNSSLKMEKTFTKG